MEFVLDKPFTEVADIGSFSYGGGVRINESLSMGNLCLSCLDTLP